MQIPLDAIDRTILNELQEDGRLPKSELASRVGLSPSASLRRVRKLEEDGVVERYAMLVNPAAIGRGTSVFVEVSLSSQAEDLLDEFEARIVECPEVMSCHLMAGDADYLVHVVCRDVEDYERIHRNHIAPLPGVSRVRSSFALRAVCDKTAYDLNVDS